MTVCARVADAERDVGQRGHAQFRIVTTLDLQLLQVRARIAGQGPFKRCRLPVHPKSLDHYSDQKNPSEGLEAFHGETPIAK